MKRLLDVWRDLYDATELVGSLCEDAGEVRFQYDPAYAGQAISSSLPLQEEAFSAQQTKAFFSALNPEGRTRENLAKIVRLGDGEYEPLLERLNDETIGALMFSTPENQPGLEAAYEPIGQDMLDFLAVSPTEAAVRNMADARLSLSGAMAKIGIYRNDGTGEWFVPMGAAPSNRIVKAGGDLFPHEVLNEAMCLDVARRCGFPVADAEILQATNGSPLLSVSRFDRVVPDEALIVSGQPKPLRLHQEDFCQVCGFDSLWKYEPTEGGYLRRIVSAASRFCDNAFGEAQLLLEYTLFDYLIGNCDNHLKNYSLLYDRTWLSKEAAPLYDIVSTTLYPSLLTDMGVSLSPSRSVFGLTRETLENAIENAGLPVKLGMRAYDDLCEMIVGAIEETRDHFLSLGFADAALVGDLLIDGAGKRAAFNYAKGDAKTL